MTLDEYCKLKRGDVIELDLDNDHFGIPLVYNGMRGTVCMIDKTSLRHHKKDGRGRGVKVAFDCGGSTITWWINLGCANIVDLKAEARAARAAKAKLDAKKAFGFGMIAAVARRRLGR